MSETPIQRGIAEVKRVCNELDTGEEVSEVARVTLIRASKEGLLGSRPIEISAGAAVVIACRQASLPYSSRDVAERLNSAVKYEGDSSPKVRTRIERTRRRIETGLNINTEVMRPDSYVERYSEELGLHDRTEEIARSVISRAVQADQKSLSGKSPSGVAGGAVYLATIMCDDRRTQDEIAQVASSEVAIRSNYHALLEIFGTNDVRFVEEDLDTERFDREVEKVVGGNELAASFDRNPKREQKGAATTV